MRFLLDLWLSRPQLLVAHAHAYGALVEEEIEQVVAACRWWGVLYAIATCCIATAAVFSGVALMLWLVLEANQMHTPWLMWMIPLLPLAVAAASLVVAQRRKPLQSIARVREQINADIAMLRAANAS